MEQAGGIIYLLLAFRRSIVTELYAQAFNRQPGIQVAACARSVAEAVEAARTKRINVALIATTLDDGPLSGIYALQLLRNVQPSAGSVILFESDEDHAIAAAFRAGAKGVFCVSDGNFNDLCRCVEKVNEGEIWASSKQLHELLEAFSSKGRVQVVSAKGERLLTPREGQIVRLVEDGLTNREISKRLGLSEHTVRNYLFRIFDKLGVSTRVELALYAANHAEPASVEEPPRSKDFGSVPPLR